MLLLSESSDYRVSWFPPEYSLEVLAAKVRRVGDEGVREMERVVQSLFSEALFRIRSWDVKALQLGFWLLSAGLVWGGVSQVGAAGIGLLGVFSSLFDRGLSVLIGGEERIEELGKGVWERSIGEKIARKLAELEMKKRKDFREGK